MIKQLETEHYFFNFIKDSLAEKDISEISRIQEQCYEKICGILGITCPMKISYWFYSSPEVLGRYLCDGYSCNGLSITDDICDDIGKVISLDESNENCFTVPPYSIHAVYEEKIKCIGAHEDTHVLAAKINEPSSDFLCEGLAMYMDGSWWGIPNKYCVRQLIQENHCHLPSTLIELTTEDFWDIDTAISYPLAGAWVEFFIKEYGIERFLKIYSCNADYVSEVETQTRTPISQMDKHFCRWVLAD